MGDSGSLNDNGYIHDRKVLPVGATFVFEGDEYTIDREIGRGGFARAYVVSKPMFPKILESTIRRTLVAKVPLTDEPEVLRRLKREASILANVRHPHVVKLHGVAKMPDASEAIIEDFVDDAHGIRNHLRAAREADRSVRDEACSLLLQALYALRELHERSDPPIYHRDVSPNNLLVTTGTRHLTLIDFGLARKSTGHTIGMTTTQLGGTPGCISPEQLHDPANIDGRSDLYALGKAFAAALVDCDPIHVYPTDEQDPVLGPLLVAMTKRLRDERPPNASAAIDLLLDGMRSQNVPLDVHGVHSAQWARDLIASKGIFAVQDPKERDAWERYIVARTNVIEDFTHDRLRLLETLSREFWKRSELEAMLTFDRIEGSSAVASLSPYASADPLAPIYVGLFPRLDYQRQVRALERLTRLAVDWDRWTLQAAVRDILALEPNVIDRFALIGHVSKWDPENLCRVRERG